MKFTCEMKSGVVLLIVGIVITVSTQIRINMFPLLTVNVTPSLNYPRWKPLEFEHWMGPFELVRLQEAGLMALATGVVLLIHPFIFNRHGTTDSITWDENLLPSISGETR
jgi:hypothetical protein